MDKKISSEKEFLMKQKKIEQKKTGKKTFWCKKKIVKKNLGKQIFQRAVFVLIELLSMV